MWLVKRCIKDYDEVFKWEYGEYTTEQEAIDVAADLEKSGLCDWAEVEEE